MHNTYPYGIAKPGIVLSGKEWQNLLVYDVGHDFKSMFELIQQKL